VDGGLQAFAASGFGAGETSRTPSEGGMKVQEGTADAEEGGETSMIKAGNATGGGGTKTVMPWVKAMVAPSNMKMSDTTTPDLTLRLEAAHGCRAGDIRGCLCYNHQEGILYPVAALVVIYNPRTGQQLFHRGHRGDVISLSVSPCGRFAASGGASDGLPRVRVWDSCTGSILFEPAPVNRRGFSLLCFSPDGHWLASMGLDSEHTLAVYM
ncbi:unnamed protein product, partial [Discosporangium mesarthrocarpum]